MNGVTKPVARKIAVSGTLRQAPDGLDGTVGRAHFLLTALPDAGSTEAVSGELRLHVPAD